MRTATSLTLLPADDLAVRVRQAGDLLRDWLASLSPPTRTSYSQSLRAFANFTRSPSPIDAVRLLTGQPLLGARDLGLRFKTNLRQKGEAPATVNRRLAAIRGIYEHITGIRLVVRGEKDVRRRKIVTGGTEEVRALLVAAKNQKGIKRLRDVALVLVLHDSGLRRSEACSMRIEDVDFDKGEAFVLAKGRAGERERVDLSADAVNAVKAYLSTRCDPKHGPLFLRCSRGGGETHALSGEAVRQLIASLSKKAKIGIMRPHDLRRAGARTLAKEGSDAEMLRAWGRWSDYSVVAIYVGEVAGKAKDAVSLLANARKSARTSYDPR